jgi:hypothetical protein
MPVYTERAAGTYRAKYLGCAEKTLTDKETNEEVVRWLWRFQELSDPATTGELAKFTGTSMQSPNSNAYKMATGILGHKPQPGDDTETHIGEVYDLFYGPNQAGNLAIIGVVPVNVPTVSGPVAAKPIYEGMEADEPATAPKDGDELPF